MKLVNILKRIVKPQHWLLEKDIQDLKTEIDMVERQLPSLKQKLRELEEIKQKEYI